MKEKAVRVTGRPFLSGSILVGALILIALLLSWAMTPRPAPHWWLYGPPLPQLTDYVVDNAELVPAEDEQALSFRLQGLEQRTKHQFVVVTVKTLNGQSIEDFGARLGRYWKLGRPKERDGVLLIVAPTERKVRIEVGYGLEKQLSDPDCAKIIRDDILPDFGKRAYAAGIDAGVSAIIERIS